MSSFISHSLAGLIIGITNQQLHSPTILWKKLPWIGWLMVVAVEPDLDYVVPFLPVDCDESVNFKASQ